MTTHGPLDLVMLKGGEREPKVVVEKFMASLRHLADNNSTYPAFMDFVRFCRDSEYEMSPKSRDILMEMGLIKEADGRIVVFSQSLHNVTMAAAVGEGLMTELESPYADEN